MVTESPDLVRGCALDLIKAVKIPLLEHFMSTYACLGWAAP
jgi:hypothetical protein